MLLYILRHGDPIYDPDTLTEKGKLQAQALAERLAVHGLDRIYSSPHGRARETAQPTCDRLGLEMQIEDWTAEKYAWRDFAVPDENGKMHWAFFRSARSIAGDAALQAGGPWYEAAHLKNTNAKAGFQRIVDASDEFLARQGYVREGLLYRMEHPSEDRVAVFCHGGFGSLWMAHLMGLDPVSYPSHFGMNHSGITIVEFHNNDDGWTWPECLCLSDTSHLYHAGLPLEYNNRLGL